MAQPSDAERYRPLLKGGEVLRQQVSGKSRNPGEEERFYPVDLDSAIAELTPEADALVDYFKALPPEFRDERLYVEAIVRPNFLSSSSYPAALLGQVDAWQVGTRVEYADNVGRTKTVESEATKALILSISESGLAKLPNLLRSAGAEIAVANDIRKVAAFRLPTLDPTLGEEVASAASDDGDVLTFEAILNPSFSTPGKRSAATDDVIQKFAAFATEVLGGEIVLDYLRTVADLTYVPVRLPVDGVLSAYRFNPLRSLRPMPQLREPPRFGLRSVADVKAPSTLTPQNGAFTVGVFDGGLGARAAGSPIFPNPDIDITAEPEDPIYTDHGASVVGATMYGLVDIGDALTIPPVQVESYRLFPPQSLPDDLYCYWALDEIASVIESGQHDIYNLSLGPDSPVMERDQPNRWTNLLDELAWRQQVLIVVAAGNGGDRSSALGRDRVQVPADMVNGLSVGAADAPEPHVTWSRAAESSVGPGRYGGRIQPLVVQYGGTASAPMPVLTASGSIRHDRGTSFAAPLVTHAVSELAVALDSADPNALRAFAVHFASRPRPARLLTEVGYGRAPLSFQPLLSCGPDEVHVLYQDVIARLQDMSYEVPTPERFLEPLRVFVTLAYASPTDPADALEYTQASLDITMRPHRRRFRYSLPGSGDDGVIALEGDPSANSLITRGWRRGRHPVSRQGNRMQASGRSERWLRDQGKWETVRTTSFRLDPGDYEDPRLHMTYLARDSGPLTSSAPPVPFALLVTVRDESKAAVLYDRVSARYQQLIPVPALTSRVRT